MNPGLRRALRPRVTGMTAVNVILLAFLWTAEILTAFYLLRAWEDVMQDVGGLISMTVLWTLPYLAMIPVLVWLPRTFTESLVALLGVLFIAGAGTPMMMHGLWLSDDFLDFLVVVALPWWQLSLIGIWTGVLILIRLGHWLWTRQT